MSGQIVHLEPDPHVAVQKLLPWYLTGQLEAAESAEVDAHLANCPECRAELETERQWQALQPEHESQADVDAGWARMRGRIAAEAPVRTPIAATRADAPPRGRRGMPKAWELGRRPMSRGWAAPALLSVALMVALGVTLRPSSQVLGDYHALAASLPAGATAVVRFHPEATEAQIRHSLDESGARLVDGPTVTDAYVVRLPRERYAASLATLRRQPGVALVEALEGASSP